MLASFLPEVARKNQLESLSSSENFGKKKPTDVVDNRIQLPQYGQDREQTRCQGSRKDSQPRVGLRLYAQIK